MSSSNYDYSHPTGFPPPPSPHRDHHQHSSTHIQIASTSYLSPPPNSRSDSATNSPHRPRSIAPSDHANNPGGDDESKSLLKSMQSISQPGEGSPEGKHLILEASMGAYQQYQSKRPREEQQESKREPSMEEENAEYDQALFDEARVKHRRRTSPPQLKILEHYFDINPKPDVELRRSLSVRLNMSPREVQVWFQNRRAKIKKAREKEQQFREDHNRRDCHSPDSGFAENRLQQQEYNTAGPPLYDVESASLGRRLAERSNGSSQGYWDASNNPGLAWEAPRQYYAPPPSLRYHDSDYHPNPSAIYPSPLSGAGGSALPSPVQVPDSYLPLRDDAASAEQAAHYNLRLSLPSSASGQFNPPQWNPNEYGGRNEPRSFGSVGSVLGQPPRVYSSSPGHVNALLAGMELASDPADNFKSPQFVHRPAPLIFRHSDPTRGSLHGPQSPGSASSVGDDPPTEYQSHPRFYQPPRQQSPAYLYHPVSTRPSLAHPPTFDNYTFGVVPSPAIVEEPPPFLPSDPNVDSSYGNPGSDSNGDEGTQYHSMNIRRASCPPHLPPSFDHSGVGEVSNGGSTIWKGDAGETGSKPRPPQLSHRHSIAAVPSPSPRALHAALSASAPASSKPHRPYPPPGTVLANFSPPPPESFSLGSLLQQHQSLANPTSPLSQSNGNGNGNGHIYERRSSALDTISESTHYSHTSPSGHRYEMDQSISMSGRRGSGWRGSEVLFQNRRSSSDTTGGTQTVQESMESGEVGDAFELVGGEGESH